MIDQSYLLGLYGGTSTTTSGGTAAASVRTQPTAIWTQPTTARTSTNGLLQAAMAGRRFINETNVDIDLGGVSGDYKKLFTLYRGLESLSALAARAEVKNLSSSEQALIAKRFAAGMTEVTGYLGKAGFEDIKIVQGTVAATSKTTAAIAKASAVSVTGPILKGDIGSVVPALEGDVRFDIAVKAGLGGAQTTKTVSIDLNDMGSTPRTLNAALAHINAALQAQGVVTRMEAQLVKGEPKTVTTNGRTTTLPAEDGWALAIRGVSGEAVSFSAPATSDAIYVTQSVGTSGANQLLKFQSDVGSAAMPTAAGAGETNWVQGRLSQDALPDGVLAVRASTVGPDGSLWVVADVASAENQPVKGQQDVALMKYDSAGRLAMTRTLGAASTASGYALAVSDDGRVAVAGSVTGALEPGASGAVATVADSFVAVYNSDGEEQWVQRRGARAADEATSVSFGADGMVYVAGRAKSAMSGANAIGGWDGYLQAYSSVTPYAGAKPLTTVTGVSQFGTFGDDTVDAMTVSGSDLYTAGVESGRAVVRRFTLDASGVPTLAATRDLGMVSGDIAGIAVADGRVVLTGTSKNTTFGNGMTTNGAQAGGTDVFVVALSADLAASGSDRLSWYGGAGDDTAADAKILDGKVWITGVANREIGAKTTDPTQAYLARIDPLTGATEYQKTWFDSSGQAVASSLAVASGGASVLDRLGLPTGEIDQDQSQSLVTATSLRTGDRFYVASADGRRKVAVTIAASETLTSLARKIQAASGGALSVQVTTDVIKGADKGDMAVSAGALQRLTITPRDPAKGAVLIAGETGRDGLAGLGLAPGYIGSKTEGVGKTTYGLNMSASLNLNNAGAVATAREQLSAALRTIRSTYMAMNPANQTKAVTGTAPAYISAQIANYQAALDRLSA